MRVKYDERGCGSDEGWKAQKSGASAARSNSAAAQRCGSAAAGRERRGRAAGARAGWYQWFSKTQSALAHTRTPLPRATPARPPRVIGHTQTVLYFTGAPPPRGPIDLFNRIGASGWKPPGLLLSRWRLLGGCGESGTPPKAFAARAEGRQEAGRETNGGGEREGGWVGGQKAGRGTASADREGKGDWQESDVEGD